MNDKFAQQAAATPSPATGSRQDTHSVGSAMSSASLAARDSTWRPAVHALRRGAAMEREGAASTSIGEGYRHTRWIARTVVISVTSGMAQDPQTPPALFDRALLHARQRRAQAQGAESFLLDRAAEDMSERLGAV